ncbi:MAG TPA: dihydroorotate dehydrogenase [Euzebyales bacterium]|nr:dihydroorotate dehydrogenase [Euzebyales bacterium]
MADVATDVDLAVDLGPLRLRNPVVTASGCFASGREMARFFDLSRLGAVVTKSVTLEPRAGLAPPRMAETASGMLNAIGLQNPGVDAWLARDLPWLAAQGVPVIASIAGATVEEYAALARRVRGHPGIAALEVNISCPNVEDRGVVFACRTGATAEAIAAVTSVVDVPVFAKLTPDVTDITAIAAAAVEAGATGLSLINTLLGMAIDVETRRPKLAAGTGGLSGPAIKPVAIRAVHQVHQALGAVPVIGIGGACTAEDVVEFVLAGASAVAIGTATFADPLAAPDAVDGLAAWLRRHDRPGIDGLRGALGSGAADAS